MATGNGTKTYGVGPAAEKVNQGPAVGVDAVLQADGKVKVDGKVVFDPDKDAVELDQPDADIDYAEGVGRTTVPVEEKRSEPKKDKKAKD